MKQAESRAWDSYDAYLFDVDGTLLNCKDAVHYFAFCDTLQMLSGRPLNLDGVVAHGNTDIGILRDALRLADVADATWRPLLQEARERMGLYVRKHQAEFCIETAPCARQVLEHLRAKGATLSVATGNLASVGQIKLSRCGLLSYFRFATYSDAFEYRKDVFAAALEEVQALCGKQSAVAVVGDTPADIQAAHSHGLPVIAVATGIYSREELLQQQPEICLVTFAELFG